MTLTEHIIADLQRSQREVRGLIVEGVSHRASFAPWSTEKEKEPINRKITTLHGISDRLTGAIQALQQLEK